MQTNQSSLIEMTPSEVSEALSEGRITLVDVREPYEHAEVRIEGAQLRTLSSLDPDAIRNEFPSSKVVFHCKAGGRSAKAAQHCCNGSGPVYHMSGGIDAWAAQGLPVIRRTKGVIPVIRQVHITAGALAAVGVALGHFVDEAFLVIPAFVGVGLLFAGVTGWCGMAKLLGVMPWNRSR